MEGMGVSPSLVAQQLALLGVGLLELNAIGFGHLDHLAPGGLQQLTVCGVCHGFLLHGVVHDHAGQFLLGDQLEGDSNFQGAGEQFFHALISQSFTEAPQLCRITRPLVNKILVAKKVLPGESFAPALNDVFIALSEGVHEVQQGHHQTGGQTR